MTRQEFEDAIQFTLRGYSSYAELLRQDYINQREAMARVEAYLECARGDLKQQERMYWDAQAQLAEAVRLLLDASDPKGPCIRHAAIKDFLLRYASIPDMTSEQSVAISQRTREAYVAQSEQQEAREPVLAGEFQREDRYIVIKRKDLAQLPMEMRLPFSIALNELAPRLPKRECLVIESDWPEYEPTWAAIQARMTGQGAQAGDDAIKLFERIISRSPADLDKATEDNPWYQVMASEVRAFAAALATQPADGEPVSLPKIPEFNNDYSESEFEVWLEGYKSAIEDVQMINPPAAAHGDKPK